MAWDSRDKYGDRDEDLFSDPYGIRAGSQRSQGSAAAQRSVHTFGAADGGGGSARQAPASLEWDDFLVRGRSQEPPARGDTKYGSPQRGASGPQAAAELEPEVQEEEEWRNWGPFGTFLWHLYAGGKKCCSMRDRSKPQDMEDAQKAAETGRPPHSLFPEPPGQDRGRGGFGAQQGSRERPPLGAGSDRGIGSSQRPQVQLPAQPAALAAKPQHPQRRAEIPDSDSESESDIWRSRRGQNDRPDVSSFSGWKPPQRDSTKLEAARDSLADKRPLTTGGDSPRGDAGGSSRAGAGGPAAGSAAGRSPGSDASGGSRAGAGASPAAASAPKRWEWPSWCLNFKSPSIEVYVVDEDTGVGRWVEAEPQSRVVDTAGRDAYLCAEYNWDGEYFVQDFGPQHVRRRGQLATVFERFEKGDD